MTAIEIKGLRKEVKSYVDRADEHTLKAVRALLVDQDEPESDDDWNWPEGISEAGKASVLEGLAQLDRGEGIPHEEAVKMLKGWPGK